MGGALPVDGDRRSTRERGATLVEYALILAVFVVAVVGAVQFLTERGSAEVADQADCVSTRPPPPSCQRATVTPETTVVPPSTSTTEAPATTTTTTSTTTTSTTTPSSSSSTTAPPASTTTTTAAPRFDGTVEWRGTSTSGSYSGWGWNRRLVSWRASTTIDVENAQGGDVRNAVVVLRWTVTDPAGGRTGTITCTTNRDGRCNDVRIPPWGTDFTPSERGVTVELVTVANLPPPAGTPTLGVERP